MTLIEQDFLNFLTDIGYTQKSAYWYKSKLRKFAKENGYTSLIDLADNVFILLDQSVRGDRKFDDDKLSKIRKYKHVLNLFNGFLFDVHYERKYIIQRHSSMNYKEILTTDKKYIPNKQPRTLKDSDDPERQWFTVAEVIDTLHITDHVLKRWDKLSEEKKREKYIPHRYKGPNNLGIDISVNTGSGEHNDYKYNYYILPELNNFLEYQFDYGTGDKRPQYLSDVDIRKSTKKSKNAV